MRRLISLSLGVFTAALLAGAGVPGYAQNGTPTLDEILGVWKRRQEKVVTARFQLNCKEMIFKGSARPPDRKKAAPEPDPPQDHQVDGVGTFLIDGGKTRYSYDRPVWDPLN